MLSCTTAWPIQKLGLSLYPFVCRRILELEEDYIRQVCAEVIAVKPDLVITEKGVSDLAQHFFVKAGKFSSHLLTLLTRKELSSTKVTVCPVSGM